MKNRRIGNIKVLSADDLMPRHIGNVTGKPSPFFEGQPADLYVPYVADELAPGWRRFVEVVATIHGEVSLKCGLFKTTWRGESGDFKGCNAGNGNIIDGRIKHPADEPVHVTFSELPDGPWKKK